MGRQDIHIDDDAGVFTVQARGFIDSGTGDIDVRYYVKPLVWEATEICHIEGNLKHTSVISAPIGIPLVNGTLTVSVKADRVVSVKFDLNILGTESELGRLDL